MEYRKAKVNYKSIGEYTIDESKLIGSGNYGKVYEAFQKDQPSIKLAVKKIKIQNAQIENSTLQEVTAMSSFNHENLVNLINFYRSKENIYIFMEYCTDGDLYEFITKKQNQELKKQNLNAQESEKLLKDQDVNKRPLCGIDQYEALRIFIQLVRGYEALHSQNIYHRDIKPQNVLIKNGVMKLADFGFSKMVSDVDQVNFQSYKCSPAYGSPQMHQEMPYSAKTDIYSLGIVLYQMLYGFLPWSKTNTYGIVEEQKEYKNEPQPIKFPQSTVNKQFIDLIIHMTRYEESDRIDPIGLFGHQLLKQNPNKLISITNHNQERKISNPIQKQYEEHKQENQDYQPQKRLQDEQIINQIDKLIFYYKNYGSFINRTLILFNQEKKLYINLSNGLISCIFYSLAGYCNFIMDIMCKVLQGKTDFMILEKDHLDLYLLSDKCKATLLNLQNFYAITSQFYNDYKDRAKTILQNSLEEIHYQENEENRVIRSVLNFASSGSNIFTEYKDKFSETFKYLIKIINIDQNPVPFEKSLQQLLMVYKFDSYFPLNKYKQLNEKEFNSLIQANANKINTPKLRTHLKKCLE